MESGERVADQKNGAVGQIERAWRILEHSSQIGILRKTVKSDEKQSERKRDCVRGNKIREKSWFALTLRN